jgi:UDP-glucose 4-epimerase
MKRANPDFKLAILRFFNVVGGHEELGQPVDQPHVLTSMLRAREKSQDFVIQGGNYRTRDGTVVRDYIHVLDVCDHIIDNMMYMPSSNDTIIQDVGTGKGTTLRELFEVFVHTVGKRMQCVEGPRRSFEDPEELIANAKFMGNLEHSSLQNIIVTATKAYEKATTITN